MKRKVLVLLLMSIAAILLCLTALAEESVGTGESGSYRYEYYADGTACITYYRAGNELIPFISIPSILDGHPVTAISSSAFTTAINITHITIPDSVIELEQNPFHSCTSLEQISVSPDHPTLAVIDGVLFEKTEKRLVTYPCTSSETEYVIPQGIRAIDDAAFYDSKSLTSITIPDSVTTIGENPFQLCNSLKQISVSPNNSTFAVIDGVLFDEAEKRLITYPCAFTATKYTIPQGTRMIGDSAFACVDSLTSVMIPDSVTTLGNCAFSLCHHLTNITIPDSVTAIGEMAFWVCRSLKTIAIPGSVTSIGDSAFNMCFNLTITADRDSYAAEYCKKHDLNYQYSNSQSWLNE